MMRKILTPVCVLLLLGSAITLLAEPDAQDDQVAKILAMPRAERGAYLKTLSPTERRGLWMQVKRAEFGAGASSTYSQPPTYEEMNGFKVDADGWKATTATKVPAKATLGTVTYDSGLPSTAFAPGSPFLLGNRFNTHTGLPVCNPGTVSTIQALVVPGPGAITMTTTMGANASAGYVLLGPQTTMGGAAQISSTFRPATGLIDSLVFPALGAMYTGSEFFVLFGAFSSSYVPAFGPGTTLGQGHHGVIGNTGMMGPNITTTTPFATPINGFIRATGVIVPVELMTFDVN